MNTTPPDNLQDSALLRALLDAAVDAVVISDANGNILRANAAACQLFQFTHDELIGQNVSLLMPGHFAVQHDRFMQNYLKTGEEKIIGIGRDLEGLRKDKTVFPLHLSVGRAVVDDMEMFVGICHDLTERKAAQDALARSQRMDAIGQMTGGIAHDFNNLLTVVIGNLELLEMRDATPEQLPLIKDALTSAELGAELTARLMVFASRSNLKPAKTDLRMLCEETLAILRRTLGATIRIQTDFANDLDLVMIDPVQLQSALMNLALNARDAMGNAGELLFSLSNVLIDDTYIAQETGISPGRYVRLSVSDDGDGMSEDAQKRAFEPFFSTKRESGGTGLGLAMVYGFVRQSGGHITLYSELGHGTSFGLYFPSEDFNAQAMVGPRGATASNHRMRQAQGETILVVEDNIKVRKLSVARIEDLGFKTEQARSGDEAYEMLKSGLQVDVVFSDLVMPGDLNGYDLAEKVNVEFPDVRVMLTSGYASDVVTSAMARGKLYDILHKPYRQSALAERLQALLDNKPT